MSSCIVQVAEVTKVYKHPNADTLDIVEVLGWQIITKDTTECKVGSKVVYFPPDTLLPESWIEKLDIKYAIPVKNEEGFQRIHKTKLRGEPSYGFIIPCPDPLWVPGKIVTEYYGAKKYNPPVKFTVEDAESPHPKFIKYTDIENLRNYPNVFNPELMCVVTEKIHGTNSRVGIVDGVLMVGSKTIQRKVLPENERHKNIYNFPLTLDPILNLIYALSQEHSTVIIFGEIYGQKIQGKYNYGHTKNLGFQVFDIYIDGKYIDWIEMIELCEVYEVDIVPIIYLIGGDELDKVKELSKGKTKLDGNHIREGVVIKHTTEQYHPTIGRTILKYISDDYLMKNDIDFTDI